RNWVIDMISEDLDTASQDPMKVFVFAVHGYPEILSASRVSDHTGVSAAFGPRKPKSQLERGIHQ
ncbi:unnamed protein product, partial [Prorocentrum cordatum]